MGWVLARYYKRGWSDTFHAQHWHQQMYWVWTFWMFVHQVYHFIFLTLEYRPALWKVKALLLSGYVCEELRYFCVSRLMGSSYTIFKIYCTVPSWGISLSTSIASSLKSVQTMNPFTFCRLIMKQLNTVLLHRKNYIIIFTFLPSQQWYAFKSKQTRTWLISCFYSTLKM